jgi:orotate phosphoribosyltransferase
MLELLKREEVNGLRSPRLNLELGCFMEGYCRELASIIASREALLFGEFTLSSGLKSNYYLDLRRLLGDWSSYKRVLELLAEKVLKEFESFDVVVGVATAGIPWASGLALMLGRGLAYVRSEVKKHGTSRAVEGAPRPGSNCIVVDDVATTGSSLENAIRGLEGLCNVVGALVIVDRMQGAGERLREHGVKLVSLLTIEELLKCFNQSTLKH